MSLIVDCFRRLTAAPARNELKGYKVTDVNRTRKFGIACRTLQELKRKACAKLNVTNDPAEVNVFLLDGSLIDEEYFYTLEPQTTLILQRPGEKVLSDADLLYDTLRRVNIDFLTAGDKVSEFLTENLKAKVAILNHALNKDDGKTELRTREEHPDWFRGLETNYTTKEAYMHRRCQDRIRSYLYKTIEQIKSSDAYTSDREARQRLLRVIAFFKLQLKEDHYFGHYFDRTRARDVTSGDKIERDLDQGDGTGQCYEHCPCRIDRLDGSAYFRLFGVKTIEGGLGDENDGRKARETRNSVDSKDAEEVVECPYRVQRGKRQTAICDRNGEFRCEGLWSAEACSYGERHMINPYRSREELVLFSTWNFDHKIERSRSLVPQLLEVSLQGVINEKEILDCYDNLFTVKNLKLVHIVCHDKGSHK